MPQGGPDYRGPGPSAAAPRPPLQPGVALYWRHASAPCVPRAWPEAGLPGARRHNFRREAEEPLGSAPRSSGTLRGRSGYKKGPPERACRARGASAAGLRDEEAPWPATGSGSSSGSAATAKSRAGGCDASGRVGVRGQGSGGTSARRAAGWVRGLGSLLGAWGRSGPLGSERGPGWQWLRTAAGRERGGRRRRPPVRSSSAPGEGDRRRLGSCSRAFGGTRDLAEAGRACREVGFRGGVVVLTYLIGVLASRGPLPLPLKG